MCLGREKVSNILFSVYLLPSYIFSFLMFFLETMWVRVVVLRTEVFTENDASRRGMLKGVSGPRGSGTPFRDCNARSLTYRPFTRPSSVHSLTRHRQYPLFEFRLVALM